MSGKNILDGAWETLVLLWVIIFQTDLEFHRLQEVPLLLLWACDDTVDALVKSVARYFWPKKNKILLLIVSNNLYKIANQTFIFFVSSLIEDSNHWRIKISPSGDF